MGSALFPSYPGIAAAASEILGYDLQDLCLRGSPRLLARTELTQPAVYVVNALTWYERVHRDEATADVFVGHSLGEINALLCAGVFDFETGLRIVQRRAALMSRAPEGAMVAVLGPTAEELLAAIEEDDVFPAAFNTATQTVVAGPSASVAKLCERLRLKGWRCRPLAVSGAFHTVHMQAARDELEAFLRGLELRPPQSLVLANATAERYRPDAIVETLGMQLTQPVQWHGTIRAIRCMAADVELDEVGSGALTRMVAAIEAEHAGRRE